MDCTLSRLIDNSLVTHKQYQELQEKLLAYQRAEQALQEKYAAYFKELSDLKSSYQVESLRTTLQNTGVQSRYFSALSLQLLAEGMCRYYAGLSCKEQEKLDEALEGEGIEFCCPGTKDFTLMVQAAQDNAIRIVRDNPNSVPDVVLEASLPLDRFFRVLRGILPVEVFAEFVCTNLSEER